jgi:hypothetical protein
VHEQELLAVVETLKRFRSILHGAKFRIHTDHRTLEHLMRQKNLSPRQHRWLDVLNEFNFEIKYIPGETNTLADALSRIYSDEPAGVVRALSEYVDNQDLLVEDKDISMNVVHLIYTDASLLASVGTLSRRSTRLRDLPRVDYRDKRPKSRGQGRDHSTVQIDDTFVPDKETDKADGVPGTSMTDPEAEKDETTNTIPMLTMAGNSSMKIPKCLLGRYAEDKFFKEILAHPDYFTNFVVREGLIFYCSEGVEYLAILDVSVDNKKVREAVIKHAHSILAHLGAMKTLNYLRDQVWWKTMVADVSDYCKSCGVCVTSKSSTTKPKGLLKTMPVSTYPWQFIGIDFVGPLHQQNGTCLFWLLDAYGLFTTNNISYCGLIFMSN